MSRHLAAVVALTFMIGAQTALAQANRDTPSVKRITIKGNRTVGDAFIRRNLKTAVGSQFSSETLNADIKRLYKMGFFSNIEVTRQPIPGGLNITFLLVENLIVGNLQFSGANNIDLDELKDSLRLKPKRPYSFYLAQLDRERIIAKYHSEGYQFVSVQVLTQESPPSIDILFKIGEGPLVGIKKLTFTGNKAFDEDDLSDQMQTEENGWFTTGQFDQTVFQEDLVSLLTYYRTNGYLDAMVILGDVSYSADKTEMELEIVIEEGPRYSVDKIVFEGNKLFTTDEIHNRLTLKSGSHYNQEKADADRRMIASLYADNAHITARITPQRVYASQGHSLSLVYQINEGRRMYVQRIEFEGNTVTQDRVLRRELLLFPGDPFSARKVTKSRRRLLSLNYFDSVSFDIRPTEDKTLNARDLIVKVTEGRTGIIRFAVGVTSNAGVIGEMSLTKRNFDITRMPKSWDDLINGNAFSGGGQFFTIQIQPGTELNRFRISFREPHLLDSPYSMGVDLQAYLRARETYDERRIGGAFSSGRQLTENLRTDWTYRSESIRISDIGSDAPRVVQEVRGSNVLTSLILGLTYDRANDPILPTAGYRLAGNIEVAAQALGGDFNYGKLSLRGTYYHSPWKTVDLLRTRTDMPHIVTVHGRLGLGSGDIPVFSRYFAGGYGTVRGFRFRTISPKEFGEPFGGKFLAVMSVEYSVPIYQEVLRAVFFTDFGSVTNSAGSLGSQLRASAGLGLRLKVPFLGPRPIAFDFGFPLSKEREDDTAVFSFSIGRSF